MKKEYKEYLVRVTYDDLRVENNYTEDRMYKSSLILYGDLKPKLNIDAYKIELIKDIDGDQITLYTKKRDRMKGDDCRKLAKEILDNINKIKKEFEYYSAMKTMHEKKKSTYEHVIEKIENTKFENEIEKSTFILNTVEKFSESANERRYIRGQLMGLERLINKLNEKDITPNLEAYINKDDTRDIDALEMMSLSHKDVRYKDEKDKKKVISTYEKDYENYIDDYKNKTICFFNRLGANKYKKPTKIEFENENNKPEKLIVADITEDKVDDKDLNKEIEGNNRTIFGYQSRSMKNIIIKNNRHKYKYHKIDEREKRIIFSNQEII